MKTIRFLLLMSFLFFVSAQAFAEVQNSLVEKIYSRIAKNHVKKGNKEEISLLLISVKLQKMYLYVNRKEIHSYDISTALAGTDSNATEGTLKTPVGLMQIGKMIGEGCKIGTIFKYQKNTGKTAEIIYEKKKLPRSMEDLITTRVLVLRGLERGLNLGKNKKGQNVDAQLRGIYIHGTNNEAMIGKPASHGCIRMRNKEVIELFKLVDTNTFVYVSL